MIDEALDREWQQCTDFLLARGWRRGLFGAWYRPLAPSIITSRDGRSYTAQEALEIEAQDDERREDKP